MLPLIYGKHQLTNIVYIETNYVQAQNNIISVFLSSEHKGGFQYFTHIAHYEENLCGNPMLTWMNMIGLYKCFLRPT
jgi:hypothetical protein